MRVTMLKTFLELAEIRSFHKAAERLNVTQSTVSSRIRELEQDVGQRLFTRSRAAAELTRAGRTFVPYARQVVRAIQQARQEIALPKGFVGILRVGTTPFLWDRFVLGLLKRFQARNTNVAIDMFVGDRDALLAKIDDGTLDLAILYSPMIKHDWTAKRLFSENLVLLSTERRKLVRWHPKYVFIDWGHQFRDEHNRAYPVDETAIVTFQDARVAFDYLMRVGGSGYLPMPWVRQAAHGRPFHVVRGAPNFSIEAFAVYDNASIGDEWRADALNGLLGNV